MPLEIAIILVLVLLRGLLSGIEHAMLSARHSRLEQRAENGRRGAATALQLQEDPDRFLATVQVGMVLLGTFAGVFGGAFLAQGLIPLVAQVPFLGGFAELIAFGIVVVGIAGLVLVLGEMVPRRLALQGADGIAEGTARLMAFLTRLVYPIVTLLSVTTTGILTLIGRNRPPEEGVTEDDIRELVREGAEGGVVEQQERQIIEQLFVLGDRAVRHIMTPRLDVVMLNADHLLSEALDEALESGYSRFPVYEETTDHIVGTIHVRDLFILYREQGDQAQVRSAIYPPLYVSEDSRALTLLAVFRRNQRHLAIVISEFGGIEGVVSVDDVVAEIVGELPDEYDEIEEPMIVQRDDGSFLIDGVIPIDEFKETLEIDELPDEEAYRFDTLAGFVISLMGKIPVAGDHVRWSEWYFEVVEMDGRRVDKLLVRREPLALVNQEE